LALGRLSGRPVPHPRRALYAPPDGVTGGSFPAIRCFIPSPRIVSIIRRPRRDTWPPRVARRTACCSHSRHRASRRHSGSAAPNSSSYQRPRPAARPWSASSRHAWSEAVMRETVWRTPTVGNNNVHAQRQRERVEGRDPARGITAPGERALGFLRTPGRFSAPGWRSLERVQVAERGGTRRTSGNRCAIASLDSVA